MQVSHDCNLVSSLSGFEKNSGVKLRLLYDTVSSLSGCSIVLSLSRVVWSYIIVVSESLSLRSCGSYVGACSVAVLDVVVGVIEVDVCINVDVCVEVVVGVIEVDVCVNVDVYVEVVVGVTEVDVCVNVDVCV